MTLGTVSRHQVPMIVTFNEEEVEFICKSLRYSLEKSYQIIDFFTFDQDDDPWDDEE